MNPNKRKQRIAELQFQAQIRNMMASIQPMTDELQRLNAAYTLILPDDPLFDEPLQWIGAKFMTSAVNIVWEEAQNVQFFTWQRGEDLKSLLKKLHHDEALDASEYVLCVFGSPKPHTLELRHLAETIGFASEFETEWWVIPRSRKWIIECCLYGEVRFCWIS